MTLSYGLIVYLYDMCLENKKQEYSRRRPSAMYTAAWRITMYYSTRSADTGMD